MAKRIAVCLAIVLFVGFLTDFSFFYFSILIKNIRHKIDEVVISEIISECNFAC